MREPIEPLFLARQTYRRRRLMDALRLLPWLGVFLFGLPLLWRAPGTASGLLYIFGAWALLIVLSFALVRRFTEDPGAGPESPGDG
jgi:hypothetical protein